jgi:hypothetical protein
MEERCARVSIAFFEQAAADTIELPEAPDVSARDKPPRHSCVYN